MTWRRLDSDTKWRIMQHEAHRTFARKHYFAIMFGPYISKAALLVVAVVGLMVLWLKVDHWMLGVGALAGAAALALGWLAWNGAHNGLQARMMARARGGTTKPGFGLGWAVATSVAMLGTVGWLSLWSPWA